MIKSNEISNNIDYLNYRNNNTCQHKGLKIVLFTSRILITIAFITILFESFFPFQYPQWMCTLEPLNLWIPFSNYVSSNFNPLWGTLIGTLISGVVFFMKGDGKQFYIQLYTLYHSVNISIKHGILKIIIQFALSFIFVAYSKSYEKYVTAGTLATFSMLLFMAIIIWYIIQYNNNNVYFRNEQCFVIINTLNNTNFIKKYLDLIFPESKEKHNNMHDEINLLKRIISNIRLPAYYPINQDNEMVLTYFEQFIIPYIVSMTKTYNQNREVLILKLQDQLSKDFSENTLFNKLFNYLLMVISREYLIESEDAIDSTEQIVAKNTILYSTKQINPKIEKWLNRAELQFPKLYGEIEYNEHLDYNINYVFYEIYVQYINQLYEYKLIQFNAYCKKEKLYMISRKNINIDDISNDPLAPVYTHTYNPLQIVFLNSIP